jgi:D-psicose/D-tagatose/L-ribulose 3-epimerase
MERDTAEDALRFVKEVNHRRVKALLDTYHLNIEEVDLHQGFLTLHDWVEVVHFEDSNRQALGQGHTDFSKIVSGMKAIDFDKTIVLECTALQLDR